MTCHPTGPTRPVRQPRSSTSAPRSISTVNTDWPSTPPPPPPTPSPLALHSPPPPGPRFTPPPARPPPPAPRLGQMRKRHISCSYFPLHASHVRQWEELCNVKKDFPDVTLFFLPPGIDPTPSATAPAAPCAG